MKESEGDRLKYAVCESTLSTAGAVPLPRWGRQRGGGFAAKKKANPASLRSAAPSKGRGSRGYSLLPLEGGAPKGRRLDGDSGISAPSLPLVWSFPVSSFRAKARNLFCSQSSRRCGDSGIPDTKPSSRGNAIKLSGRTFLAPYRGSSPKGRGSYAAVLHESGGISIVSDYST